MIVVKRSMVVPEGSNHVVRKGHGELGRRSSTSHPRSSRLSVLRRFPLMMAPRSASDRSSTGVLRYGDDQSSGYSSMSASADKDTKRGVQWAEDMTGTPADERDDLLEVRGLFLYSQQKPYIFPFQCMIFLIWMI